jgi:hypothetical protein
VSAARRTPRLLEAGACDTPWVRVGRRYKLSAQAPATIACAACAMVKFGTEKPQFSQAEPVC